MLSEGYQGCQPQENPVLPESFPQIYILYEIGFTGIRQIGCSWECPTNIFVVNKLIN